MRKLSLIFILLIAAFAFSEEKELPKPEVFQIREIGELSTTEYTFSKVLRVDDKVEWWKFWDRKILISCKAKGKAGIDLKAIPEKDIWVKGDAQIGFDLTDNNYRIDQNKVKKKFERDVVAAKLMDKCEEGMLNVLKKIMPDDRTILVYFE
jgi:hypothetical protein